MPQSFRGKEPKRVGSAGRRQHRRIEFKGLSIALSYSRNPVGEAVGAPKKTVGERNCELAHLALDDGTDFQLRVASSGHDDGPVAILLPALGAAARFYERFARRLSAQGVTSITVDLRGQGESGPTPRRHTTSGYKEIVESDLPRIVAAVGQEFPGRDFWLIGHSLGGQLALVFSGLHRSGIAGVVLIATGSAWYGGFSGFRRVRNLVLSQGIALISRSIGFWPGDFLGFGGRQSRVLMQDWAAQVRTGRYRATGSNIDYEAAMSDVRINVHIIEIEGDMLAPPGCVDHLSRKIPNANVTRWRYSHEMSGTTTLNHFSWARQSPGLAESVAAWIHEH